MTDKTVIGVDPVNGRSKLTYVDHSGPASYVTGGETWPQQSALGGPNALGLNGVNWVNGGLTEDGSYFVVPVFGGIGARKQQIKLKWFVGSVTVAPGAVTFSEVTAGTNLSSKVIRLAVLGG